MNKKRIVIIICILLLLFIGVVTILLINKHDKEEKLEETSEVVESIENVSNAKESCSELLKLYPKNKVYTSIPNNSPRLLWNVARIYLTDNETETGAIRYQLHNEKVSGEKIGDVAKDSIKELVGYFLEMRYTKDNPLIVYQIASCTD